VVHSETRHQSINKLVVRHKQ